MATAARALQQRPGHEYCPNKAVSSTGGPTRLLGPSHRSQAPPRMQKLQEGEGKRKGPRLFAMEGMQDPAIPLKPEGAVPLACSQLGQLPH